MSTNVRPRREGAYKLQSREGLGEARAVGSATLTGWFWVKDGLSEPFPHLHSKNNEMYVESLQRLGGLQQPRNKARVSGTVSKCLLPSWSCLVQ